MLALSTSLGQVSYDSEGQGDPIVLLASGAHDHHDYDMVRSLLPDRFRSIAVDWPGHGESPAWPAAPDEVQLGRLMEELLESLCPDGAVLVGNSIGGNVSARLAITRPDLVKGLMIIDGGGFEQPRLSGRVFCSLMSHPAILRGIYPLFSRVYMRSRTDADRRARSAAIATTRTPVGAKAVSAMWRGFNQPDHDLRAEAGRISAPTVIVWGRHDPVLPLKAGEAAKGLISGSRLVVVDSGHQPETTDPATVAAELVRLGESAFATTGRARE